MEDTLRDRSFIWYCSFIFCLNPCFNGRYSQRPIESYTSSDNEGLNPCFNGRYSQRNIFINIPQQHKCLNPCFNGRYSQSAKSVKNLKVKNVLILVLMEDTLRAMLVGFLQPFSLS